MGSASDLPQIHPKDNLVDVSLKMSLAQEVEHAELHSNSRAESSVGQRHSELSRLGISI